MSVKFGEVVNLAHLKSVLDIEDAKDDKMLISYARSATRLIEIECKRSFIPYVDSKSYDHPGRSNGGLLIDRVIPDDSFLMLFDDLLELSTLTTNNGGITITSSDYHLVKATPQRFIYTPPYNAIQLDPDGTYTYFQYTDTPYKANAVTGTWGYHTQWDEAWVNTKLTINGALAADAESITFNQVPANTDDVYGEDSLNDHDLIKIDSEYFFVKSIEGSKADVTPAANGTTSTIHNDGATVYRFSPDPGVSQVVLDWAIFLYRSGKMPTRTGGNGRLGSAALSSLLTKEHKRMLNKFKRVRL